MTATQTFLTGLAISLLLSLIIVFYLNKSLTNLLNNLCGIETHAKFWAQITNISFVLVALLMPNLSRPEKGMETVFQLSRQLGWTLCGLIITVVFVSMAIFRFIDQVNRQNSLALSAAKLERK